MAALTDHESIIQLPVCVLAVGAKPNAPDGEDPLDCVWVDVDGERALCLFSDSGLANRYCHETGLPENVFAALNPDLPSVIRLLKDNQSAGMTAVAVDPAGSKRPSCRIAIQAVIDSMERSIAGLQP